jgi:hypothetical protein
MVMEKTFPQFEPAMSEWAVVPVCADGKRAKFSHRRLRNGIRGGTLDFDHSEILA